MTLRTDAPRRFGALSLTAILFAAACSDSTTAPEVVGAVSVSPGTVTLASGAATTLTATVADENGRSLDGRPVSWVSTNTELATVSATGTVTAGQNRDAVARSVVIVAASGGQLGTATVTVTPVPVAAVRFSADSAALEVGASVTLTVRVDDAAGIALSGRTATFTSLDTAVATVSAAGMVTARAYDGEATRSARIVAAAESRADTLTVVVAPLAVATVAIAPGATTLVQGDSTPLAVELRSADGRLLTGRSVQWTSADPTRLQVTAEGFALATPAFMDAPLTVDLTASISGVAATTTLSIVSGFELAANGVTIRCPLVQPGDSGVVDGVTYTKRTREDLLDLVDFGQDDLLARSCTSGVTDMNELFFSSLRNPRIARWDVSDVTNMSRMFLGATEFNQPLGAWDVRNVTRMDEMFRSAFRFNQPIGDWDTRNVTDMSRMFNSASVFNQPVERWNVGKVTTMRSMFLNARSFNQPLNTWNVANVTDMNSMFAGAIVFNQPLEDWNVANVTTMFGMFANTEAFNRPLSRWDVGSVTSMSRMFNAALAFNHPLGSWDVGNVGDMSLMFSGATAFNQPLWPWDVSGVTNFTQMFEGAGLFNQDLSTWCVTDVASAPLGFATSAASWARPQPAWGTCSEISLEQSTVTSDTSLVFTENPTPATTATVTIQVRDVTGMPIDIAPVVSVSRTDFGTLGTLTRVSAGVFTITFSAAGATGGPPGETNILVDFDGPAKRKSVLIITLEPF